MFTATIEYIETREDKVKGLGDRLQGKLVVSDNRNDNMARERVQRLKVKIVEQNEELENLESLIEKFDMNRYREKVMNKVSQWLE